jgi:hypothetical protein
MFLSSGRHWHFNALRSDWWEVEHVVLETSQEMVTEISFRELKEMLTR